MPVAPMPTTPTRLPARSMPPAGHFEVCRMGPRKLSWPSKGCSIGAESMPAQLTKNWASITSPASVVLVEVGAGDGGGELDVLAQVEPVGDVVQPALDLGLTGELLAPAPVLVELLVEVVLVDVGLAVEPRPRVAVPPPGSAHVARLVDRAHPQPLLAQLVELVQPGDPGTQDDGGQLFGGGRCGRHRRSFVGVSASSACGGAWGGGLPEWVV